MSPDVEVHLDNPDVQARVVSMSEQIVAALGGALSARSIELPEIRVVVTPHFEAAIDDEVALLSGEPADPTLNHEGFGSTHGRTLRNYDWSKATVVVRAPTGSVGTSAEMGIAKVLAHEISHVAYGAAELDAIGVRDDYPFGFQPAAIIAVHAAEEYRVERLGIAVVDASNWFRADDQPLALADLDRDGYRNALPAQLELCARSLAELASECRHRGEIADDWWPRPFAELLSIATSVAYTEADSDGFPSVISTLSTQASDLLRPLIDPFVEYVVASSLIPTRDEWENDIRRLESIGTEGSLEVLRQLGIEIDLTARTGTIVKPTWALDEDVASD